MSFTRIKRPDIPANYSQLSGHQKYHVRILYVQKQNRLCYYCGTSLYGSPAPKILKMKITPELYPKGFFDNKIHLHHDHQTDLTLGVVHAHCNAVLWEYHGE